MDSSPFGSSFVSKSSWRSYHETFFDFVAGWASSDYQLLSMRPRGVLGQSKHQPLDQDQERTIFSPISFG